MSFAKTSTQSRLSGSRWSVYDRRDGRADLWTLRRMRFGETESDIAFLGVEPYSKLPMTGR